MQPSDDPIFYVYVYLDPRKPGNYRYNQYYFDYEPFYVGKGSNGRDIQHLSCKKNKHLASKLLKIKVIGKPIIIRYNEHLTEQISFNLETSMITTIGRSDLKLGPLCNHTDGGDGVSGLIWTDEGKKNLSEILSKQRKGQNADNCERIRKQVITRTGQTKENSLHCRKISESLMGNKCGKLANQKIWKIINMESKQEEIVYDRVLYCKEHNLNYHTVKRAGYKKIPYKNCVWIPLGRLYDMKPGKKKIGAGTHRPCDLRRALEFDTEPQGGCDGANKI